MCSLNRECVCCEKNCKSMFAKVCCALNDNLMYYIHNNHPFFIIERWDEFFIKKTDLLKQTIFMFFLDYALHNGKSVSLGNYVREKYSSAQLIKGQSVSDYPEYKRLERFFKRRAEIHKISSKPESVYDIIAADFNINIRQETHFLQYTFEDRIPDKKNYPNDSNKNHRLEKDIKFMEQIYADIRSSNDSYFLKSVKFYLLEHFTYFEHYYQLAKILKRDYIETKRKVYSYNAFYLRYVRQEENNQLIFFPFMTGYENMYKLFLTQNTNLEEAIQEACRMLGQSTNAVKSAIHCTSEQITKELLKHNFDVEHCPSAEYFFKNFFGCGQHILKVKDYSNDIDLNDIRIMYCKELSYDELFNNLVNKKQKKKELTQGDQSIQRNKLYHIDGILSKGFHFFMRP